MTAVGVAARVLLVNEALSESWTMPGCRRLAVLLAKPAGVTALVVLAPAITSALVAKATPPTWVGEAGVSEIEAPTTLIPPVGLIITPPNCDVEAAERLIVTEGPEPPPVRPEERVILLTVPVPGGRALRVPSGAILTFAPARTPPRLEPCGGNRVKVPVVVIVPPVVEPFVDNPGPAVTPVKVPPREEALTITP